jgi:uncharacterized membrane protein
MTDQPVEPVAVVAPVPEAAEVAEAAEKRARPHPFIRYTSARIALFVVAVVVVWLVRLASGVLLVIVALLISGLASFALLGRQRAEVSAALFERRERQRTRRWAAYDDEDGVNSPDAISPDANTPDADAHDAHAPQDALPPSEAG